MQLKKTKLMIGAIASLVVTCLIIIVYKYFPYNVSTDNTESNNQTKNIIEMNILGKQTIYIDEDRINNDIYEIEQLDNRWDLSEIDNILNAVKGTWKIEKYVGFVHSSLYYPDLYDSNDNLDKDYKEKLYIDYDYKKESAKKDIPEVYFSIKEYKGKGTNNNYIYVNDKYRSPVSIVLSTDRLNENYPIFSEQTTISSDFYADYPVLYIKFFITSKDNQEEKYIPATLVISSDNQFLILIDGAFYSLTEK